MNMIGRSQEVSWRDAYQFLSDYVLLPLVILVVLLILIKHVLTD